MNIKFFHLLVIFLACRLEVKGELYIECISPDKLNTFVASQSSCSRYIYCDGENSFAGECLDDNYFNEEAGNCDDPAAVKCMVGSTEGITIDATSMNSTSNYTTTSFVDNSISSTQAANRPTKKPASYNKLTGTDNNLSDIPQCPRNTKAQPHTTVYLPNPRTCSAYFICYYGIAIPMSCPPGYNFNALLARCERQEEFQCAQNRPARIHCVKGVYDLMPHPDKCEYYYFCANGFLMIFQCPYQFMWHFERRTCVHRSLAKCYDKSNMYDLLASEQYSTELKL